MIAVAREALGVAHAALELACEHARTRQVFDQPVGRFQGVAHPLAECYARLPVARGLADWALEAHLAEDPHAMVAATIARAACAEAAVQTSEQCVQVYGARGYRADYPAHLLLRRAEWTRLFQTSSAEVFAETGRAVLAGELGAVSSVTAFDSPTEKAVRSATRDWAQRQEFPANIENISSFQDLVARAQHWAKISLCQWCIVGPLAGLGMAAKDTLRQRRQCSSRRRCVTCLDAGRSRWIRDDGPNATAAWNCAAA